MCVGEEKNDMAKGLKVVVRFELVDKSLASRPFV